MYVKTEDTTFKVVSKLGLNNCSIRANNRMMLMVTYNLNPNGKPAEALIVSAFLLTTPNLRAWIIVKRKCRKAKLKNIRSRLPILFNKIPSNPWIINF